MPPSQVRALGVVGAVAVVAAASLHASSGSQANAIVFDDDRSAWADEEARLEGLDHAFLGDHHVCHRPFCHFVCHLVSHSVCQYVCHFVSQVVCHVLYHDLPSVDLEVAVQVEAVCLCTHLKVADDLSP